MLQGIRDRAQSALMWVIVMLIIIPFALWGIHQYFGGGGDVAVASVNGRDISLRQFQEVLHQQRSRLQNSLEGGLDLDEAAERRLRQDTLDRLIEEEVLVQTVSSRGMGIGDTQLAASLHGLEPFQEQGRFSPERYERWLRTQGYVAAQFEHSFRRVLLTTQLQSGIAGSAFLTEAELRRLARLEAQKRSFAHLLVPAAPFRDPSAVTEEQVASFYREHADELVQPEQVRVQYLELTMDALAAGVSVPEDELRRRYDGHQASYGVPEQRRARHILLTVAEDAGADTVAAVTARARDLAERIRAGASFEDLARESSADPGSAQQGGDLGFFGRGTMVEPFEEAVFAMRVGEVSEPVRSPFGLHVIRLDEVRAAAVRPFEEVRQDILREVQRERAEPVFFEQAERLTNLTYENPDSLEPAAHALGIEIRTSDLFGRSGGAGVAAEPKVVSAAFSDEVLQRAQNSEPLELGGARVVVLRVEEHRPAAQRPLEAVRSEIVERLASRTAHEKAVAVAAELLERLRAGEDLAAVAGARGLEWVETGEVGREASGVAAEVVTAAFQVERPAGDRPTFADVALPNGDVAVIALRAVSEPHEVSTEALERIRRQIEAAYGRVAYTGFVQAVRAQADVETYKDRLQQ
jgi:peptidyl-prolyl cis-trans isomerase D